MGWFIVTIVGFLTAVVAFLIIRGEQWLFDLKEGYCNHSWWKARQFCCPEAVDGPLEACPAWRTWSELLVRKGGVAEELVEYVSYSVIAVRSLFPIFSLLKKISSASLRCRVFSLSFSPTRQRLLLAKNRAFLRQGLQTPTRREHRQSNLNAKSCTMCVYVLYRILRLTGIIRLQEVGYRRSKPYFQVSFIFF